MKRAPFMGNASAYYGGPGGRPPWARSGLGGHFCVYAIIFDFM
jgi:hypothetical protein